MPKGERAIYLKMKTLEEARAIWSARTMMPRVPLETLPVVSALHRVTAEPVIARRSVPHYHGAAMDGIAVKAEDTFGASDVTPRVLRIGKTAFPVDTGDPLPDGTDSVIMIEDVEMIGEREASIRSAAFPWRHVRKVGEDIVAGEMVLPRNHRLRPADLGALLAAGLTSVKVFAAPQVWIQPTGTELVGAAHSGNMKPGEIIEFNGAVLAAMTRECGGTPALKAAIADDYDSLKKSLQTAAASTCDVILMNAGSSAGTEDYTASLVEELGEVLVHGVTMMPGKPVVLGIINEKPVVGIPGYPVSAILAFEQFVRPLLYSLQGLPEPPWPEADAVIGRKTPSKLGLEEFVRVIVGRVGERLVAMPLQRGAGIITSLTRADGIVRIPQEQEGLNAGDPVRVRLLRPDEGLENTLIVIGSHDNAIDLIANELRSRDSRLHLSSSNVGSMGGLMAVKRGEAHLAGSHLLDTETGGYNTSYIERYLKGTPIHLVTLARRNQGLLVKAGNPLNIRTIEDLARPEVTFMNRQAGSGTRILFDYYLDQLKIAPEQIKGYEQEEFTHMAVAVAVVSGRADAGMAISAAAKALNLEFIPAAWERYDLVIAESAWEDPKVKLLLDIIQSEDFRESVHAMGGYDVAESGKYQGFWDGERWR